MLESQDDFVQLKATQILTVLLRQGCNLVLWSYHVHILYVFSAEPNPIPSQYLQPFINTLASFIAHSLSHKRDIAVQCLEAVLPRAEVRKALWNNPTIVAGYWSMFCVCLVV
jgi:V-type H+-transporting ATPase subunit H